MLSIIIPVYNSELTISTTVDKLAEQLDKKIEYEIILVNDGSTDSSYQKCRQIAESNDFIKFISLSKNFGQHNAMFAGLKFVEGDFAVILDDDLQTPPEEIWKFIDKINEGYDVVYANYIYKNHNIFRNIGSNVNAVMANILLNKPRNIKTSSYCIIRKYLIKEILKYEGPYPYVHGLVLSLTKSIGAVSISHSSRMYGRSNYNYLKLFRLWLNGFTNFSVKPLRIAFFFGLLCSFTGFVLALILLIRKLLEPLLVLGWTSTILTILFFSGIQLISVGLIGEYVGRIFMSQNKQPQYAIKETFNTGSKKQSVE